MNVHETTGARELTANELDDVAGGFPWLAVLVLAGAAGVGAGAAILTHDAPKAEVIDISQVL
jgi:hypothetical protein